MLETHECQFKVGDRVKHCKMFLDRLSRNAHPSDMSVRINRRGVVVATRWVGGTNDGWWDITVHFIGEGRLTYMERNLKKLEPGES